MAQSPAEYYRERREAFEASLRWKCTPIEALHRLRREKMRRLRAETSARLDALRNAPITPGMLLADGERAEPWYKQGSMA